MNTLLSSYSASVSELKKNPSRLIEQANGESIAILNHNKPTAYLVPVSKYEELMEAIDDQNLAKIIKQRAKEKNKAIEVSLNEL
jgi:antitoxin StbD